MAKLYFRYGAMGCGKTMRLQVVHDIEEILYPKCFEEYLEEK